MNRSIRGTLLSATALSILALLVGAGFLLHGLVERELLARLDRALLDEAQLVSALVEVEVDRVPIFAPRSERDRDEEDEHEEDEHEHDDDDDEDDDEHDDEDDDEDEDDEDDDDDDDDDEDDDDDDERRRRVLRYEHKTFVEVEFAGLGMPAFAQGGEAFLEIRDAKRAIYRSPSLGGTSLPEVEKQIPPGGAWIVLADGRRVRALALAFVPRREHDSGPAPAPLSLVLARRAEDIEGALAVFTTRLIGVGALTLLLATLGLVLTVRFALRPLETLSQAIATVGPADLTKRIELPDTPQELLPVVARTNELLGRLSDAFARERAFSSEVAHELRTPLAGLRTTLEVLLRRPREVDEYQEALTDVTEQLESLGGLVDRLLQIGRLEAREVSLEPRDLDLSDAILTHWELLEPRAEERELKITWELAPTLPARADANLLNLALRNLLENAVEYTDLGGQIWIRGEVVEGRVEVAVENTGSRLDPTQVGLARRRFWRGENARSDAGRHCGLGLALVDRAVEAMGAALYLQSSGGRFEARLVLPPE
jgi:signal transduction histidine kinase